VFLEKLLCPINVTAWHEESDVSTAESSTLAAKAVQSGSFSSAIVAEASGISGLALSEPVLERARQMVLDWLGVTIAGAQQPSATAIHRVFAAEGGTPVAGVFGTAHRFTARQAALATGDASHALDYDDMGFGGHPAVVIMPAVFAVAEQVGANGLQTVEALVQACEVMHRIDLACGRSAYPRGFHLTGTIGAFAAAMGAGRLLGLDQAMLVHAMGVAGTQAAGLKASFGTMSKHLNAGNAAAVGVLSAMLAREGFTGAEDIIEGPQGMVFSHNGDLEAFDPSRRGDGRLGIETVMFKFHAACGGTHSAINGINAIKARRPFTVSDVERVDLAVPQAAMSVCGIAEPVNGVEAMFSIAHAASLAIADRTTAPSSFTDASPHDPELIAARKLVHIHPTTRLPAPGSANEVTVRLKNGEVHEACLSALIVAADHELADQWNRLEAKFVDLVTPVLGGARTDDVIAMIRSFESLDSLSGLVAACVPAR